MAHYPINLNLKGRKCIVVGGGTIAERKIATLLEFDADVTVIAPDVTDGLAKLATDGLIRHIPGVYTPGMLTGALLVIAATSDRGVNAAVYMESRETGILVNVVDDPDLCTFFLPAIVRRGDLLVSISTSGKSPSLAKRLRDAIEAKLGPEYGDLADILGEVRDEVKAKYADPADRVGAYARILDSNILELLSQGKRDGALEIARKCI